MASIVGALLTDPGFVPEPNLVGIDKSQYRKLSLVNTAPRPSAALVLSPC